MKVQPNIHTKRGSALIVVFWLIAILGMVIFGAAKFVSLDSRWIVGQRKSAEALRNAEIGLALGSHPLVTATDPILISPEGKYRVDVTTEESLIPINVVLSGSPEGRDSLKRLFRLWGVDERSAAAVADALGDWVDADDLTGLNGAEAAAYEAAGRPGLPFNEPFSSVAEMANVLGMDAVAAANPNWASRFTVHSSGQFDLNEATADSISAVLGVPFESAQAAVERRDVKDGGGKFLSVAQALQTFGAVAPDSEFFTIKGATRRIVSDGFFDETRQRLVEVRDGSGNLLMRAKFTDVQN